VPLHAKWPYGLADFNNYRQHTCLDKVQKRSIPGLLILTVLYIFLTVEPNAKLSELVKSAKQTISVPDPDPPVFGGGSGSGSTSQRYGSGSGSCSDTRIRILLWFRIRILLSSCKNIKKNLDSYYFVALFDFLSLKNDVNVPSKVISRKNCVKH
jgi:hypothetical protein